MKKVFLLLTLAISIHQLSVAQNVGIGTNTPAASAALEIKASDRGLLIPRTSTVSRIAIVSPAKGLMVYDTTSSTFWYHNGSAWQEIGSSNSGWSLTGNTGTTAANFIGTTDDQPLRFRINGVNAGIIDSSMRNTAVGFRSLDSNTIGRYNTANGYNALFSNTYGFSNTANGYSALFSNIGGFGNTANGYGALSSNTTGGYNTANGSSSLVYNTTGKFNTATGADALSRNTTGSSNTAFGDLSLGENTTGSSNTAFGDLSLRLNTTGYSNVAIGTRALFSNTILSNVVAIGDSALFNQNGGFGQNTAVGSKALYYNTTGSANTANGFHALYSNITGSDNTALGNGALTASTTTDNQTAIGFNALQNFNSSGNGSNTAVGNLSMQATTDGYDNTAVGDKALTANTTGYGNTVLGHESLFKSTTAINNSVVGNHAMYYNTTGFDNTSIGKDALYSNTTGGNNTAIGSGALYATTTGGSGRNTALGYHAGYNFGFTGFGNVFLGDNSGINVLSGSDNTFLGNYSTFDNGTNGYSNSVALGRGAAITSSNQIVLGDVNIGSVIPGSNGATSLGTSIHKWSAVYSSNGSIQTSDVRLKTAIVNTSYGLKTIMALRPVLYNWKAQPTGNRMSGFIAQEVEKLVPEAVEAPKNDKEFYGMKYDALIPVLTKGMQEQQTIIESQDKKLTSLQQQIDEQKKQNTELLNRLLKLEAKQ